MAYASWTKFTERVLITGGSVQRLDADTGLPILAPSYPIPNDFIKPTALNSGLLTDEGSLTLYTGSSDITVADTVLEGYLFTHDMKVKANNVTIRDCLFAVDDYATTYGVRCTYGNTGTLVEYCEFRGHSSAAIYGGDAIFRHNHVHHMGGDCSKLTGRYTFESNYITNLGYNPSAHADGIQITGGGVGIIRGNNFDMISNLVVGEITYKNSQCMIIATNESPVDDLDIYNNWITGGIQSILINEKTVEDSGFGGNPTNCRVHDNIFTRDSWTVQAFSVVDVDGVSGNRVYGNVYSDNGALLPGQGVTP